MKKSERLLEAVGMIDEKHLPDPESILKKQGDDNIQEYYAEMTISDGKKKKAPFKWAALGTAACAAAVAGAIFLNNSFVTDKDGIYKELLWESRGANLELLPVQTYFAWGLQAYDISEIENNNPWSEDLQLETLPVFRNKGYSWNSDYTPCLTDEQMTAMAENAVKALGLEAESSRSDDVPTSRFAYSGDLNQCHILCSGEKYGTEKVLVTVDCMGNITVKLGLEEYIYYRYYLGEEDESFVLPLSPDEYRVPHQVLTEPAAIKEQVTEGCKYLTEYFKDLIMYKNPAVNASNAKYASPYGANETVYDDFDFFVWDQGDNIRESILNYSLANTRFSGASPYPDEEQQLQYITINNTLSIQGEYVGDYPLTSVREAKEKLLSGKYTIDYQSWENVPPLEESSIKKVELVYYADPYRDDRVYKQEYFMPYYCFYAEVPAEHEGNYYFQYYVPAISDDYLDQSGDQLFKPLVWETNTENLVNIPAEPFRERGSGTVASDISMIENSNPWTEDLSLDRMPVFLNKAYGGTSPEGAACLSDKEMWRAAELAARILGVTIDESRFNYFPDDTQPPVSFYAYCDGSNYGTEQVRISVSSTGTVYIRFDRRDCIDDIADEGQVHDCYTLPEGYYGTDFRQYPDDVEQESKTMQYLAEQFGELMSYGDPQLMLNIRPLLDGGGKYFSAYFTDKGKDTVEDILNYNFKSTYFYFNSYTKEQLFSINIEDMLATQAEYLGDYPIITAEQARALLLSDKYSEYFSEYNITADSIKRVEGVYVKDNDSKYFQPYYCLYVETPHENGMKEYIKYYIPAIDTDGYAAEGALTASDPVFPEKVWDTKTAELPLLDPSADLDYSWYFAHNASEIGNQNNPWNESLEFDTLPVFLNMNYGKQNDDGYVLLLTEEEMTQTAERAADKLGLTIEDINVVYANDTDTLPAELTAVCNGEKYGVEQIKILVHGRGDTVYILFGEKEGGANYNTEEQCYQLPDGYKLPCSVNPGLGTTESQEEDEKAINLMYEQFKALTGYDNPEIAVSNMPHYSNLILTEYKLWDKDEDIVRNILNYNLTGVKFISNGYDQKQLWGIELSNSLYASHYAGDYPIITVQEAKEMLLSQDAMVKQLNRNVIVPAGYDIPVITEERIEKTELIYGSTMGQKYLMPYYRFYVRSEKEAEGMEGYYEYSPFYVSAIWDAYLNDTDMGIYPEVSSWGYKTDDLPQITSRFTFHGSGADGFNALYLRSGEQVANPYIWQREFELTEAPVFRSLAFNADRPYEQCYLDAEEMERMARAAANALNASMGEEEWESFGTADNTPATLTVKIALSDPAEGAITVKSNGDLYVTFDDGIRLPEYIDTNTEAGLKEAAEYFKGRYSELIQYVEADTDLVYDTDNDRYELYIHQHSEDVVRNMVNYYLNNVRVGVSEEQGVITEAAFYNRLFAAEYLGDYPLVSYDEAVELLLKGDYRSYVKKSKLKGGVISEGDILYGELVYNNGKENEYFQPYYKFYVELNETADWFEHSEDEKAYGVFWVPAVVEEYRGTEKFLGADEKFLEEIYGKEEQ